MKSTNHMEDNEKLISRNPSSKLLLEIALNEYREELGRANGVDNRVGFLIPSLVALLAFYIPSVKLNEIIANYKDSEFLLYLIVFLHCATVLSSLLALIFFSTAIIGKEFHKLCFKDLTQIEKTQLHPDIVSIKLLRALNRIVEINTPVINKKFHLYKWGLMSLVISAVLMSICSILVQMLS